MGLEVGSEKSEVGSRKWESLERKYPLGWGFRQKGGMLTLGESLQLDRIASQTHYLSTL